MANEIARIDGGAIEGMRPGMVARHDFGGAQLQAMNTAIAAVVAREKAAIEARYVMAERNPRNWDTVRIRLLEHCDRSRFAEICRYKKPAGRKKINGEWKETFAEGLSARFAEVARQEMSNIFTETSVIYEDELIRTVRASVCDLERNYTDSREFSVAKAVERHGRQDRQTKEWIPPEGRDVLSQRINSEGEPTYLVRATEDECRNKQNSEISKVHRDGSLRLLPKDIRDDCEDRVLATLRDPKKTDPAAARKRVQDSFARIGVLPDDLVTYMGCAFDRMSPAQLDELRGLWSSINEGETTFQSSLKQKYDMPKDGEETREQHDARLQRQMAEQLEAAKKRDEEKQKAQTGEPPVESAAPAEPVLTSPEPDQKPPRRGFGGRGA